MDQNTNVLSQLLGGAIEALATRPQKTSVVTETSSYNTPYALEDMIRARKNIGLSTKELDEVLKLKESPLYGFASTLASTPQQEGYGSWLSSFARGLGSSLSAGTDARVARAMKKSENEMKDLADILAFDKAMGETTSQRQKQTIGYDQMEYGTGKTGVGKSGSGQGTQQQVPVLNPEYWEQMIANFDKGRPTEASYRNMPQLRRNIRNRIMTMGDPDENYARDQFATAKGREFLPLARNALKGAGQITDFEDKKYTEWLNAVKDPVQLKDTAVRIVKAVAMKNRWSKEQEAKGLELLGLQSTEENLLEQQKKYEPERIKTQGIGIDALLEKFGAKRVE